MRRLLTAFALVLPLTLGGAAVADDSARAPIRNAGERDCAIAKKKGRACEISFKVGDTLTGGTASAGGDDIVVPESSVFGNLIKLRSSFRAQIIKTAEEL